MSGTVPYENFKGIDYHAHMYLSRAVMGSTSRDAIIIGRFVDPEAGIGLRICYGGDQGVVIFGPNGKGKGVSILIPNLLRIENKSIVVIDPKGELCAVTGAFRKTLGRVVVLNPYNLHVDLDGYEDLASVGFNPLRKLNSTDKAFNRKAAELAEACIVMDEVGSDNPHFPLSARALIAVLIMYTVVEAEKAGTVPTFTRVRELLCLASSPPSEANDFEGTGLPKLALQMIVIEIENENLRGMRNKASQFVEWTKEIQSVASTAKIQTEPFDDPEIADDMAKDGFDFADLKREVVTVYLILPPLEMARHAKWLRMLLTSALQENMRARKREEKKILFMMDEFFTLGRLAIFETAWAAVRGYGIQMMPILQDLNQLQKLWPNLWETIIGSAGITATFSTNDMKTAEYYSRRAGDQTRDITTRSYTQSEGYNVQENNFKGNSENSGWSRNQSTAPQKTPLITPHSLFGLRPFYMLGTIDGLANVVPIYAPPYFDIADCLNKARANPYHLGANHDRGN